MGNTGQNSEFNHLLLTVKSKNRQLNSSDVYLNQLLGEDSITFHFVLSRKSSWGISDPHIWGLVKQGPCTCRAKRYVGTCKSYSYEVHLYLLKIHKVKTIEIQKVKSC